MGKKIHDSGELQKVRLFRTREYASIIEAVEKDSALCSVRVDVFSYSLKKSSGLAKGQDIFENS